MFPVVSINIVYNSVKRFFQKEKKKIKLKIFKAIH